MSKLRRNEKVITLGVFALGLAAISVILIAPPVFAQGVGKHTSRTIIAY